MRFLENAALAFGVLALAGLGLSGCGSGSDPLSIMGNSDGVVTLSLPSESAATSVTPFSTGTCNSGTANDYCSTVSVNLGTAVTAPGDGFVSDVVAEGPNGTSIYIFHNSHITTKVNITSTTVRKGDVVAVGSALGTLSSGTIRFFVYYKGTQICPQPYLSTASKSKFGGGTICQ